MIVVGEAPGAGDPAADRWRGGNWTGLAYTARHSGRLVRRLLADAGLDPDACYLTNAVKCFPVDPDDPTTNREPTAAEREACRSHLAAEVAQVAPRVVVPTGRHATASVLALAWLSLDGFLEAVLAPRTDPALDWPVLPLLHPSYEAVWRQRLGFEDRPAYVAAVARALEQALGVPDQVTAPG